MGIEEQLIAIRSNLLGLESLIVMKELYSLGEISKDEYVKMMKAKLDSVSDMMTALMKIKGGSI